MNIYQTNNKPGELVLKYLKSLDNHIVQQPNTNTDKFDMRKLK
jgi:hypothetical protein